MPYRSWRRKQEAASLEATIAAQDRCPHPGTYLFSRSTALATLREGCLAFMSCRECGRTIRTYRYAGGNWILVSPPPAEGCASSGDDEDAE